MLKTYELVIIGGGASGLSAAISAYEEGVKDILIIERNDSLGGVLNQCIHNGFGLEYFKEELSGPTYASRFIDKIKEYKIEYVLNSDVLELTKDKDIYFSNEKGYHHIKAKAIICSTGCYERNRGAINIDGSRPSGVMTAGTAQRYLNNYGYMVGKKAFILGSGDIGLIMARRLTLSGAKVLGVAEIMPYSNGLNRNIVQCLNDYNIPLYLSHTVKKVVGKTKLEKIILAKVDEKMQFIEGTEMEFDCDVLLLSVGLVPSNKLLEDIGCKMHPRTKGPIVNQYFETSIEGIFACGNNLHVHDLVDYVTLEASDTGKFAAKYIKENLDRNFDVEVANGNLIGYVVPAKLKAGEGNAQVKFRVSKPVTNARLIVKNNDKVLKSLRKDYLLPSLMEIVKLDLKDIEKGELKLEVELND